MKYIYKVLLFFVAITLLNGCHDSFLEEKVFSNITPPSISIKPNRMQKLP